jgi:thiol-disulfide isomerase/thioredoxin
VEILGPEAFDGPKLRRPGTWVVNFSAEWCPFCAEFLPKFGSLGGEGEFELAIGDLTDVSSPLWDWFQLEVTPTVVAFRDGGAVFRRNGRRGYGLDDGDLRALRTALEPPDAGGSPEPNTRP